jgi:predicted Zn-dependent peptidase
VTRRTLLLGSLLAGAARASEPPKPERLLLDGGVELLVVPDPNAPAAALAALVRLGPEDEQGDSGAASLLARLVGAEAEGRGATQIQRDVDGFGAIGAEYDGLGLAFWAVSSSDTLSEAARTLLINVLAHPVFAPDAFASARDDLNRQRQRQEEDLFLRALEGLRTRVLGSPVHLLGTERSLAKLTPARLEAFHTRFVRPSRTTLLAIGKVVPEEVKKLVSAQLGAAGWLDLPPAPPVRLTRPVEPLPRLRDLELPVVAPATAVALGYLCPGMSSETVRREWPVYLLLDTLLGGGKGARLFALRDRESLGYDVHTLLAPGRAAGMWAAYLVGSAPLERVKEGLRRALADAATGNFTEAELARARAWRSGQRLRRSQRLLPRLRQLAQETAMGVAPETEKLLESVTLDEVNGLARRLFAANAALVHTVAQ